MKNSKLGFAAGPISIIFGIIGILTVHYIVGIALAIVGMIFGYLSYGCTNTVVTYIGIILCNVAIVWLAMICIFGGK